MSDSRSEVDYLRSYIELDGSLRSTAQHLFPYISIITVISTYILMVLGSYTSAIGAGLSCPDWPACYGTVVPFLHPEIVNNSPYSAWSIFAEWAHRGLAMVTGVLIFTTAIMAWRTQESLIAKTAIFALILLPLQVGLGGMTVIQQLEPLYTTAHFATATLILASLTVSTTISWMRA